MTQELPLPPHFAPARAAEVYRVPYEELAPRARAWAQAHGIAPATNDARRLGLLLIDVQNTFCLPEFELYVRGRSGTGAVDDNRRLADFIYRNLGRITRIVATLDTHHAFQIFHAPFLIDAHGRHPPPFTRVSLDDVERGRWRFNPGAAPTLGIDPAYGQRHLEHYVRRLQQIGKYELTVWPYHGMLGGIGHALVSLIEEAVFFHGIARDSQPDLQIKGRYSLTEAYSVLGPEVMDDPDGRVIAGKNDALIEQLLGFDALVVAGQAQSHCVAWTVEDLRRAIEARDATLARRVYLLEDCTSPVVVPGAIDYTEQADRAFRQFAQAGMHVVRAATPMAQWPGMS